MGGRELGWVDHEPKAAASMHGESRNIARVVVLWGRLAMATMMYTNKWRVVWEGMHHMQNVHVCQAFLLIVSLILWKMWCCEVCGERDGWLSIVSKSRSIKCVIEPRNSKNFDFNVNVTLSQPPPPPSVFDSQPLSAPAKWITCTPLIRRWECLTLFIFPVSDKQQQVFRGLFYQCFTVQLTTLRNISAWHLSNKTEG